MGGLSLAKPERSGTRGAPAWGWPNPKSKRGQTSGTSHEKKTCIHDTNLHKDSCFEPAPGADDNLPCIGVAANANGVGKLCLESWESAESAGEHKVEKTPQLA